MRSENRFHITGNIGSINEVGSTVKVNVATSKSWTDDNNERKDRTDWVTITVLNENSRKYLLEKAEVGMVANATGKIANNNYEKDGKTVYTTDLIADTFNLFQTVGNQ